MSLAIFLAWASSRISPTIAGHRVHLGGQRELLGFDLVAHRGDGAVVRPDERDARLRQRFGERLALGEEAVAGMHGLARRYRLQACTMRSICR